MVELSSLQKDAIAPDKQQQFLKLARTVQTMISNVKYVLAKILLHFQYIQMDSEILSAANIISKLKKVIEEFISFFDTATGSRTNCNRDERQQSMSSSSSSVTFF